jgi:hypothetical protein
MKTQPRPLSAAAVILVLSVLVACTPGGGGSTAVPAASAVPGSPLVNPPSTNPSPSTAGKPGY